MSRITPNPLLERLGRFEQAVIKAIYILETDAYCVAITDHLERQLGRTVSAGQTSRALAALSRIGILVSERVLPAEPVKHQRSRIVYTFTEHGRRLLADSAAPVSNSSPMMANAALVGA